MCDTCIHDVSYMYVVLCVDASMDFSSCLGTTSSCTPVGISDCGRLARPLRPDTPTLIAVLRNETTRTITVFFQGVTNNAGDGSDTITYQIMVTDQTTHTAQHSTAHEAAHEPRNQWMR